MSNAGPSNVGGSIPPQIPPSSTPITHANSTSNFQTYQYGMLPQMPREAVHTPSATVNYMTVAEYCDRIKYDYEMLNSQLNMFRIENERLKADKNEIYLQSRKSFEVAYYLNIQHHRQQEFNSRLFKILEKYSTTLPLETQKLLQEELESAKRITLSDIEKRIKMNSSNNKTYTDPFATEILIDDSTYSAPSHIMPSSATQPSFPQQQQQQNNHNNTIPFAAQRQSSNVNNNSMELDDAPKSSAQVKSESPISETDFHMKKMNGNVEVNEEVLDVGTTMVASSSSSSNGSVPKQVKQKFHFNVATSVSSVTFGNSSDRVYIAGKGFVSVFSVHDTAPIYDYRVLSDYIRSCKLSQDEKFFVACGETSLIDVMDITKGTIIRSFQQPEIECHYGGVLTPDSKYYFSCFANGDVGMWDISAGELVKRFEGHSESATCIDISPNGRTIATGSLDKTLKIWDVASGKEVSSYQFPTQIFALGICPTTPSCIALGLESSVIEVVNTEPYKNYELSLHESSVLALKYAKSGDWFISGGKDKMVNIWKSLYGPGVVRTKENNSILSLDIAPNSNYFVTGGYDKQATLYECIY